MEFDYIHGTGQEKSSNKSKQILLKGSFFWQTANSGSRFELSCLKQKSVHLGEQGTHKQQGRAAILMLFRSILGRESLVQTDNELVFLRSEQHGKWTKLRY